MNTLFINSSDETRIAYDVTGSGPAMVLLHGWGQTRKAWHSSGYVRQFEKKYKVITIDLRGTGESDKPTICSGYRTEQLCEDILNVAGACGVDRFILVGYSNGGNIGRYISMKSNRVSRLIDIGFVFGKKSLEDFHQYIQEYQSHWQPIVEAQANGILKSDALSPEDKAKLETGDVPIELAWFGAMLDWTPVFPADLSCPTLWIVGSNNEAAMASAQEFEKDLLESQVELKVMRDLSHLEEFTLTEKVIPELFKFLKD